MRPRRVILNAPALVILFASVALLVNFYTARVGLASVPLDFESVSPDKTYRVLLSERRETKVVPFSFLFDPPGCPAEFGAYKDGRPLFEKNDVGDDSNYFADLFPEHAWVSDSVFRLGERDAPRLAHDELSVTNDSRQSISYLRVMTCKREMFLLFDVPPGETVKLAACPQTDGLADLSWVAFQGRLADGRELPFTGENFKIRGVYVAPAHYRIKVSDDTAKVDSTDFEVYR
jgi:hypothetical protein